MTCCLYATRHQQLAISHKSTQSALSVLTEWQMMQLIPQLFFRLCYWCTSTVLGPAQIRNMHSIPDQQSHESGAKSSKFRHRFQAQAVFLPAQCASGAPLLYKASWQPILSSCLTCCNEGLELPQDAFCSAVWLIEFDRLWLLLIRHR